MNLTPSTKKYLGIAVVIGYVFTLLWLSSVWYNDYTSFHFFNDVFEWEYLDKLGHCFASFQLGLLFYKIFGDAANLIPPLRKKWICFAGFFLLLPIEVLDGFSLNYGASPADVLANGVGSLCCYWFTTIRIFSGLTPKFSFHSTAFSMLRPDLLGSTFLQQTVKDYNGQTYWLSIDANKIFNSKVLPGWLLLTVGYGAEGLLGGHDNVWENKEGNTTDYSAVTRTKRILISIDINRDYFNNKGRLLMYLVAPFALLKFPAPALEFNGERGLIFHPIYF